MRLSVAAVLAAAVLALPAATSAASSRRILMHWTVQGVQRTAIVFAPTSSKAAAGHPLVFAFHGHGGNARGAVFQMHVQTLWPQAIVVYPQGLNSPTPHDPSATRPGWQFKAGDSSNRDLKLFDTMVADLEKRYRVDLRRIYTTGFSNGAIFSYLLWAERARVIAAVGSVAGALDSAERLRTPRALIAISGRQDTTLPFEMQTDSIALARQVDSATGAGIPCGPGCTIYESTGGNKTPVKTFVHPGAHVYPPWAPTQIVRFFKRHPQP